MIIALDVGYTDAPDPITGDPAGDTGRCAVVAFEKWTSVEASHELVIDSADVAPYVSGRLYERELPCLLAGLEAFGQQTTAVPDVIIVDGNVRLDPAGAAGLGAYLFDELGGNTPIVGVAKNEYSGLDAQQVLRGDSARPLYVTAAGMDELAAAGLVRSMAGDFRLPLMLRRVDVLTRREPGT